MVETISFEDLMRECNFDDPLEFRRILKRNGLPVVSSGKPVARAAANTIVQRLLGRKVNWYRYEVVQRDLTDQGPLQHKTHDPSTIEAWFTRIAPEGESFDLTQERLLGVSSEGGFLRGNEGPQFALRLDPHINILIGDRGSGKSTALNLLGLLADSVSEEAVDLVTKLLTLLDEQHDATSTLTRRVRRVLREYGIKRCAVFFVCSNAVYCFSADLNDKTFDILCRSEGKWISQSDSPVSIQPSIQVLQQGEVIAIADEKSRWFLHNILDGLHRDLHDSRTSLASAIKRTVTQRQYFTPAFTSLKSAAAARFLDERNNELSVLKRDRSSRRVSDQSLAILDRYVAIYRQIDKDSLPNTFSPRLKDETSLYYLYLGRTRGTFESTVRKLKRLDEASTNTFREFIDAQLHSVTSRPPEEDELREHLLEGANDVDDAEASPHTAIATPPAVADLLQESLDWQKEARETAAVLVALDSLIRFLRDRKRVLERWITIYETRRLQYNAPLAAMVNSYADVLRARAELIALQEAKCNEVATRLNDDEFKIDLHTLNAQQIISDHLGFLDNLTDAERLYGIVSGATAYTNLSDLEDAAAAYDLWSTDFLKVLRELRDVETVEDDLLFSPISLRLRQGNVYREFTQLSFGQKSGIILKMVLGTTYKPTILIDQPEDNLDATSIVNMLAPTLNRLGATRQIIIATHNSHLVMGLANPQIHVLGSLGENGGIRNTGAPLITPELVREMLEVLEGGFDAFNQKLQMYDQFLTRVSGSITDIDITLIETSFRRRTIDGLRNFLQPIVSDRSLMDFLRHELKQPEYSRIQQDLVDTIREIDVASQGSQSSTDAVLMKIRRLCERLDSHILKLRSAIEEIRLLDTHPHPVPVDIAALLSGLAEEYTNKLSKSRQVTIDLSPNLHGHVFADPDHLRLVFKNLLSNSLRATEKRVVTEMLAKTSPQKEIVTIDSQQSSSTLHLTYVDNGCGISPDIRQKLYIERCTDQKGRDHGLGAVIIRKLLDLSGGRINILKSNSTSSQTGTIQEIWLPIVVGENAVAK
jgi:signal transduction histidine kinase